MFAFAGGSGSEGVMVGIGEKKVTGLIFMLNA